MVVQSKKKVSMLGLIVWSCCLVFFLYEFFLRTFVGTLAQKIITDLHLTSELFALMGSAYYVAYGLMQVPVGYLTERFGAKKIVVLASFLCGCSVILFASSNHFTMAFFSRLLMGFGSSFGFVSLLVVITNWFPQQIHANLIGLSQFIGTLGPLIAGGPLASIIKSSSLTWKTLFVRVGFFGFAFAIVAFFLMRNKPREFSNAVVEIKKKSKLAHLARKLLKNKQVWFIAIYSAFVYETVDFLGAIWGTYYLQSRGLSLSEAGYTISAGWLGYAIGCFVLALCSQWLSKRKPVLIFCGLLGLICVSLIIYVPFSVAFIYQFLFFFIGMASSGQGLAIAVILEHVQPSIKALALGFNNGLIILFGAIAPIIGSIFIHIPKDRPVQPHDFITGFSMLPILFFVAFVIATFFIKETFCRPQKQNIILSPE